METKKNVEYPFDYQKVEPEVTKELSQYFALKSSEDIRLGSKGYFFYKGFEEIVLKIYKMELRASDTFVVTYPRSGTTWSQELVWLLQNNLDLEAAKSTSLTLRFPFIESGGFLKCPFPNDLMKQEKFNNYVEDIFLPDPKSLKTMPSPRFLKSHLPLSLLPPSLLDTVKVVYVAREPRDVAVSYFFHLKSSHVLLNDTQFKQFWNLFIQDKVVWSPYFEHVKEAWNQRNHPNMAFIFYEELLKDLPAVARRLATFFGKQYSDEQYQALCHHLNFDNFKNNASVNFKEWQDSGFMKGAFIRKGQSGGWREHFDAEMTQQAERWIADNLRDTDLRFPDLEHDSLL